MSDSREGRHPCPRCGTECDVVCVSRSTFEQYEPSAYRFTPVASPALSRERLAVTVLAEVAANFPQLRLGQLLENAGISTATLYYTSDDVLVAALREYQRAHLRAPTED